MRRVSFAFAAALGLAALPAAAGAQAAPAVTGTVLVAHGAGAGWNDLIYAMAREVRTDGPVEVSFLMGPAARTTRFQDAVAKLQARGATEIVVVPVLVSSYSGHYDQIRYLVGELDSLSGTMLHHLHMAGIDRPAGAVKLRLARAIDDSPGAARIIAERARALVPSQEERALFIIGHGPNSATDHAEWMDNLRRIVSEVRKLTAFDDVRVGLVRDDAPAKVRAEGVAHARELIELQYKATGQPVVVVPVAISSGRLTSETLPRDLAGLPIVYDGAALLPHPGMARWVEARVREVTNGSGRGGSPADVNVTLSEFQFSSSRDTLQAGTPYRFVLRNTGSVAHEWAVVPRGARDEAALLIEVEEDALPPGATVVRTFTFSDPGDYDFACFMPGHYESGMKLPITVTQ